MQKPSCPEPSSPSQAEGAPGAPPCSGDRAPDGGGAGPGRYGGRREKLTAARVAQMRELVEGTTRSYVRIGAELGLSTATISRYATEHGWRRPPGAALSPRIARQRDRVTEKLWRLTARHVDTLREQPLELAQRSLQPLASLTRALGTLSQRTSSPGTDDLPPPAQSGRSLNELRDELAAHLARIAEEEGYGWDEASWWFEDGGGI